MADRVVVMNNQVADKGIPGIHLTNTQKIHLVIQFVAQQWNKPVF
jgi:hypothetical protein